MGSGDNNEALIALIIETNTTKFYVHSSVTYQFLHIEHYNTSKV